MMHGLTNLKIYRKVFIGNEKVSDLNPSIH